MFVNLNSNTISLEQLEQYHTKMCKSKDDSSPSLRSHLSVNSVMCILLTHLRKHVKSGKCLDKTREFQSAWDFSATSETTRTTFFGLNQCRRSQTEGFGARVWQGSKKGTKRSRLRIIYFSKIISELRCQTIRLLPSNLTPHFLN